MKKKLRCAIAAAAVITAILAGFLAIAVHQRERQLDERKPPTIRDLEMLKERFLAAVAVSEDVAGREDAPEAASGEKAPTLRSELPDRLENACSLRKLEWRFKVRYATEINKARAKAALHKLSEAITAYISPEEVGMWASYRGSEMMALGDWDAARHCYWGALDGDYLGPRIDRGICAKLAWLERDPEMAYHYLELSCEGDKDGTYLSSAVDLCLATGSNALAEHYLARLRTVNPQLILRDTYLQNRLENAGIAWEMDNVN